MKRVLLILSACLLFAAAEARKPEGAHLALEHPTHDFGDVPRKGGDVTHDFHFRNEGTEPLVVLRVITSCSCVKASFPKRPVAPGGEGVIRITYQPHKSEPGTFHKVIRIQSNAEAGDDLLVVQGCAIEQQPRTKVRDGKVKVKYK